jgi:hypothetical protein
VDVSSILLAAGTVLGTKAIDESTKLAVGELWSSLKSLLKRQKGGDTTAVEVLEQVERTPAGQSLPPALFQQIQTLNLTSDPAVNALLQQVEALLQQRAPNIIQKQNNFYGGTFQNATFN